MRYRAAQIAVSGVVLIFLTAPTWGQTLVRPGLPGEAQSSRGAASRSAPPAAAEAGLATPNVPASDRRAHDSHFVIGNDDLLAIQVWKEPDISRSLPVRSDGKISLPLAGEMQAAGQTPLQLEREITDKLRTYITDPEVTVIVQEIHSEMFNILGQVARPGSYPLTHITTVLDAIAIAGGFRDFARQKAVYILRQDASGIQSRIPFNYKTVIKGKTPEQNVTLEPRDTVIVP